MCAVRQAPRIYVGFARQLEGPSFGATAVEAHRVMQMLDHRLCSIGERDLEGSLRAALATRPVEIAEVMFIRADLGGAHVRVRPVAKAAPDAAEAQSWTVVAARHAGGWQIASAAPAKAPASSALAP